MPCSDLCSWLCLIFCRLSTLNKIASGCPERPHVTGLPLHIPSWNSWKSIFPYSPSSSVYCCFAIRKDKVPISCPPKTNPGRTFITATMKLSLLSSFIPIFLCPFLARLTSAQSTASTGYTGYSLSLEGEQDGSTVYDTASTPANVSTTVPEPDVYLNASVSVGEIDITVSNLTAKINLDVQVLQLLTVSASPSDFFAVKLFVSRCRAQISS